MKEKRWILYLLMNAILAVGFYWISRWNGRKMETLKSANDKLADNYQLLNHWLEIKNEGKDLAKYFSDMGYRRIAVYGMAELANRLAEDLEESGIDIIYGIDRDASCAIARIADIYSLQNSLPEVDAIIVTPYYAFEAIKKDLEERVDCAVISLEEVVWSV